MQEMENILSFQLNTKNKFLNVQNFNDAYTEF